MPEGAGTKAGFDIVCRLSRLRWSRPVWLRAAVINALIAGLALMSHPATEQDVRGALLRQAAQIQLMHAMGTIACATFMNMGAASAARAPSLFVLGTIFYAGPVYLSWSQGDSFNIIRSVGVVCLAFGWLILIMSASEVDRAENNHVRCRSDIFHDHTSKPFEKDN